MLVIKHHPSDWDTMPDVSWSVRDDAAIAANHPAYYTGYDKPNYPMPAIRYEARFMPYVDEVWTAGLTRLCLAIFKPRGFGYICERYWFND